MLRTPHCKPVDTSDNLNMLWATHCNLDSLSNFLGSSADINTIHNLLNSCGFKSFNVGEHWRSAVTPDEKSFYVSPKRYSIASYCRDCWQ